MHLFYEFEILFKAFNLWVLMSNSPSIRENCNSFGHDCTLACARGREAGRAWSQAEDGLRLKRLFQGAGFWNQ